MNSKKTIWLVCGIPFWIVVGNVFFSSPLQPPFWSTSVAFCGYSAAVLLAICLIGSPLARSFPKFNLLNRYKKQTGLAAFYYALLHVSSYFIKKLIKNGALPWEMLLHPMIIPGEIAFFFLFLLAITSNRFAKDRLGRSRWKNLHRTVYLSEGLIFLHMFLQGDEVLIWGFIIFVPLFVIQRLRLNP